MEVDISNIDFEEEIDIVTESWDSDVAIIIEEKNEILDGYFEHSNCGFSK